jgi:glycosyltransferase involved in cell wall biosynthesis
MQPQRISNSPTIPQAPAKGERLCVVMPVYNEEEAIGEVLEKWCAALDGLDVNYEIRPYNDGSKDGSLAVMRGAAARLGGRVSVRDKPNGGHGPTILQGYREAAADGFDWVFQIDSDDEMGPEKFRDLWERREGHDFLVGVRDGRKQAWPRKVVSAVSRWCVRVFYGKSVWDVNTPYRLMRVSAFRPLWKEIPSGTFAPNVIISGLAARHGLRCWETPVPHRCRTTGTVSIAKWKLAKAAAKSFSQTVSFAMDGPRGWLVFAALAAFSTAMKFFATRYGPTFDYESYEIVADIANAGGNVYAETIRYNYGPLWFLLLGSLRSAFGGGFRMAIVALLSLADAGIGALLWRSRRHFAAALFLLSLVSVYVTGVHNQFDNLAVALALGALALMDVRGAGEGGRGWAHWAGVALLGVSVTLKHVFVFFPFWLLFGKGHWRARVCSAALPLVMFGASFLPYAGLFRASEELGWRRVAAELSGDMGGGTGGAGEDDSSERLLAPAKGIRDHVFLYRSDVGGQFHEFFVPAGIGRRVPATLLWAGLLVGLGWVARKKPWFEKGLIYALGMFVLSTAVTRQYYAIPAASAAAYWWPFGLVYHLGVSCVFFVHERWVLLPAFNLFAVCLLLGCLGQALRTEIAGGLCRLGHCLERPFRDKGNGGEAAP